MFTIASVALIVNSVSLIGHALAGPQFSVTGKHCANPWDGYEGPSYGAAMQAADRAASQKCYPYQTIRLTQYLLQETSNCPDHYWGSQAQATYQCADVGERTEEECNSAGGPIKGC